MQAESSLLSRSALHGGVRRRPLYRSHLPRGCIFLSRAAIAVDPTSVYWTENDKVMKVPISGGTPTPVALAQDGSDAIAVDATNAYWANRTGGTV
jgi:hypothetical protein